MAPISTSSDGTKEAVAAITPETILATYKSMIEEDTIDIYVAGDIDETEIAEKLKAILSFGARPLK